MLHKYGLINTIKKIVTWIVLFAPLVYLWIVWDTIPNRVPTHFNALGEADAWGHKNNVFLLFLVNILIFTIISIIERFPAAWNTGVKITEENRIRIYSILRNMIITIKLFMSCIFSYLILKVVYVDVLANWILTMIPVLITVILVYYGIKLYRNK